MFRLVCILIGYFFGCVQSAYILGKLFWDIDIRNHGSGNAGTSNVLRVLGLNAGFWVFLTDILKAVAAYVICSLIFSGSFFLKVGPAGVIPGLYGGLGVVLGHNFPFFLKFKGGKGIASSLGVILCFDLRVALICYIVGLCVVIPTRYISAASLTMLTLLPILSVFFGFPFEVIGITLILCALAVYLHRENIVRLKNGNERKFSLSKKTQV